MNKTVQYPMIPSTILAFLLDKVGEPSEISPRHLMPKHTTPNSRQAEELYDAGITASKKPNAPLTPKYAHIAKVLLQPRTNLTFRVWAGESHSVETNLQFPGYIRDGEGVTLNQRDNAYNISAFYDEGDIVKQLADILPDMPALDTSLAFEASLPATALATLFGLIDLYRLAEFIEAPPYSSADINGYIQGRWGLSNFENLLTYILALGYDTTPPTQVEVEASLSVLIEMQIVEEPREGYYELAPKLLPFVSALRGILSGLQWERISMTRMDELILVNRLWLYGSDGLVMMLVPTGDRRVYLSSVSIDDVKEFLIDDLLAGDFENLEKDLTEKKLMNEQGIEDALRGQNEPLADSKPTRRAQPEKRADASKASISPIHIKPKKTSDVGKCPVCGAELPPNAKFCGTCGKPVAIDLVETSEPPPKLERVCPHCHQPIGEKAKFCGSCGKSVD